MYTAVPTNNAAVTLEKMWYLFQEMMLEHKDQEQISGKFWWTELIHYPVYFSLLFISAMLIVQFKFNFLFCSDSRCGQLFLSWSSFCLLYPFSAWCFTLLLYWKWIICLNDEHRHIDSKAARIVDLCCSSEFLPCIYTKSTPKLLTKYAVACAGM